MDELHIQCLPKDRRARPFGDLPVVLSWLIAAVLYIALAAANAGAFLTVILVFNLHLDFIGVATALFVMNLFLPFWMALANFLTAPLYQLLNIYTYCNEEQLSSIILEFPFEEHRRLLSEGEEVVDSLQG